MGSAAAGSGNAGSGQAQSASAQKIGRTDADLVYTAQLSVRAVSAAAVGRAAPFMVVAAVLAYLCYALRRRRSPSA